MTQDEIRRIIEFAIRKEEEAYKMYSKAQLMTDVEKIKLMLIELAEREKWHKERLESLRNTLGNVAFAEAQLPPIEDADANALNIASFTSLEELFKFALEAELSSKELYNDLAASTEDVEVKKLFFRLALDEEGHARDIKNMAQYLDLVLV